MTHKKCQGNARSLGGKFGRQPGSYGGNDEHNHLQPHEGKRLYFRFFLAIESLKRFYPLAKNFEKITMQKQRVKMNEEDFYTEHYSTNDLCSWVEH